MIVVLFDFVAEMLIIDSFIIYVLGRQGQQFSATDEYKKMEACLQRAEQVKASFLAKQQMA